MSSPQSSEIPVGLIGLGKHGVRYLQHIQRDVKGLRVVAISRRDESAGREMADELGVRFHADPAELVADSEVRAVISAVPPTLNAGIVEACLDRGRPLLIEKPFATDTATAFRLRDRVQQAGLPCLVAQTLRYSPVVREVRNRLSRIGPLRQILLTQSFEPSSLAWLDDPVLSGGGNILHTGVHMFDLLRYFSGGEVTRVSCFLDHVVTERTEDNFSAAMQIEGSEGVSILGATAGSRATLGRAGAIRIVGEHGHLVADHVHHTLSQIEGREILVEERLSAQPTLPLVLEEFARVAAGQSLASVGPAEGAAAVAIAEACYRSAETGSQVVVPR